MNDSIDAGQLVLFFGYAAAGFAFFLLTKRIIEEAETRAAQANLEDQQGRQSSFPVIRAVRPFLVQYVVPFIRARPFWEASREKGKRKILSAGLREEFTPDEYLALRLALIFVLPIFLFLVNFVDIYPIEPIMIIGSAPAGFWLPELWINSLQATRQKKVLLRMPFVVDLLALSTEAGLDFVGAIGKVVEKSNPSPLIDELGQVLKEMKVGSSRQDSLRDFAARLDLSSVNSFVAILISADQMGASIGKILRQQSEQLRMERMIRAEKAGAAAAQMVILPVVMFILPAVMLMIFGPYALSYYYGGES